MTDSILYSIEITRHQGIQGTHLAWNPAFHTTPNRWEVRTSSTPSHSSNRPFYTYVVS